MSYQSVAAVFGAALLSTVFGVLAATSDPVIIGLGVSIVLGPILLMLPTLTIWVILSSGLLLGVLSASPQLGKVTWAVSLLSILLLVPSLVNIVWNKQRRLPPFMLLALLSLIYSLVATLVQWYSLAEFAAGFKRYYQSYGLMLALTVLAFPSKSYIQWRRFLMLVALLQLPFALYELIVLVPQRGGPSALSEATDVVAGTFGANIQGGSPNSVMVIYLFIAISFITAHWRAKFLSNARFCALIFLCALPICMGETKISVVMLPLIGLILLRKDFANSPLQYLPAFLILLFLTFLLGSFYVTVIMHSTLAEVIESTLRYNVGDQGYSKNQILNRFTSITFWFQQQRWDNPLSFFLGNGLGSSYTSQGTMAGHLGSLYHHYGINLTAASTLLWDTGLIGFCLFLSIFVSAWWSAGRLYDAVSDKRIKADALAIQAAISLFVISIFYVDSIVNLVSMELIYSIVLGYLGYLTNSHNSGAVENRKAERKVYD